MSLDVVRKSCSGRVWWFWLVPLFLFYAPPAALGQAPDEAAIRSLAQRYFDLYQKRDVGGLVEMWHGKSPNLAAAQQALEKTFTEQDRIEVMNLTVRKVTIEGDKASARVALEVNAFEAKTGKAAKGFGRWNRTLWFAKEGSGWKVWQSASSEEEFAAAVSAAQSDEARRSLLEGERELWDPELVGWLAKQGRQQFDQGKQGQALSIYTLALGVAEATGDRSGKSDLLRLVGLYHSRQAHRDEALRYYQESLSLAKEAGNKEMTARALNSIGVLHLKS